MNVIGWKIPNKLDIVSETHPRHTQVIERTQLHLRSTIINHPVLFPVPTTAGTLTATRHGRPRSPSINDWLLIEIILRAAIPLEHFVTTLLAARVVLQTAWPSKSRTTPKCNPREPRATPKYQPKQLLEVSIALIYFWPCLKSRSPPVIEALMSARWVPHKYARSRRPRGCADLGRSLFWQIYDHSGLGRPMMDSPDWRLPEVVPEGDTRRRCVR